MVPVDLGFSGIGNVASSEFNVDRFFLLKKAEN